MKEIIRIYAGVVLFNPDISRLKENLSHIYRQVDKVILIDNASENIKQVEGLIAEKSKFILVKNSSNIGIASALNQIIKYGLENQYDWTLTLDQDSVCDDHLIEKYVEFINNEFHTNIGCLTCNIVDRNFQLTETYHECKDYKIIDYCITSGSLMNLSATNSIGLFDGKMFIDKVDCDICINLRKHGYKVIQINYNGLLHEVGHAQQLHIGFRKWEIYNHSALRRYYMTRNASYLLKKYHNLYVIKIFFKEIFHTLLVLMFEDSKKEKLKQGLKGFIDGFKMIIK